MHRALGLLLSLALFLPGTAGAQLAKQSELTLEDRDPSWEITLEHLAQDSRWMGLAPRSVTWAPDGSTVYFRWRLDPKPGQNGVTDPWFAVDRAGSELREVTDPTEIATIPDDPSWSLDRSVTAWSSDGELHLWDADAGHRIVYSGSGSLSSVRVTPEGDRVFFSTTGFGSNGDLWVLDLPDERIRQIAQATIDRPESRTEAGDWLAEQQKELLQYVREQQRDEEIEDSVRRTREVTPVQTIPVEPGWVARQIQLSPDRRFLTFQAEKDPGDEHRTEYFEAVNESGYARVRRDRPKVGEPQSEFRTGIVAVRPELPADSVEVTWVDDGTEKETILWGPHFSPDGSRAVVQILSLDHKERWISLLDLETGETTVVDHQQEAAWIGGPLVGGRWGPGWIEWLHDGSAFAFASTATGWSMLYLAEVDGREPRVRPLTSGDWEVRDVELSADGRSWYLVTSREHPGEEHLYRIPARGGDLERITGGEGMNTPFLSPRGDRLAVLFETEEVMPDLFLMDPDPVSDPDVGPSPEATRITKSGSDEYFSMNLLDREIVTLTDYNGEEVWAEVWERPENPNGAAVVVVKGCGECSQAVTKGWRRVSYRLYAKYLNQRGYQTANLDYRGSSGYGHANRTYGYRNMGVNDIDSGLPLLDLLERDYGVERGRIGVYGGSYGGFFTIMALFRRPDRWRAGVALYPVTDWAHYNHGYTSRILNGAPYEDDEAYRVSSPVYYVDNYEGGLQIQHGLVDGNVQIQDSFRLAQMLMEKKKPFDLQVYPVEPHGWRTEASRHDSYRRMTEWFDRELLGPVPDWAVAGSGTTGR